MEEKFLQRIFTIKRFLPVISILVLLIIWKLSALIIGADIILPPPEKVLRETLVLLTKKDFVITVFSTLYRTLSGFILSMVAGLVVGVLAGLNSIFRLFIKPVISVTRSTPVIALILLALIWFNVSNVPIFTGFLMGFPIVAGNIIQGILTVDKKLLEMAELYKIGLKKQIFTIYIPWIMPFILAAANLSLGVVWKVVIAAEVLSQPKFSIGTSLNEAKAFLLTEEVFAWTIIALILSGTTELVLGRFTKNIRGLKHLL